MSAGLPRGAGDLTERIHLFRAERIPDGLGGHSTQDIPLARVSARVLVPRSKDGIIAGRENVEIRSHEITIRVGAAAPASGDYVIWNGLRLRVGAARPVGVWIVMDCTLENST